MNKLIKILLLEDLPSDIDIIWRSLERAGLEFERMVIETRKDFIQALNEFSPDIILADHSLPSFNSHEALIILTATNKKIPFILITSTMSEEFAVDAIKRGADDYIIKDRLSRLPAAINSSLEKFRIERERQFFLNEVIKKEKYYRALIENSADVVLLLNQEGKPTYSSPSLYRILGYTDAAAKHLIITHNIHPDDQPHAAQKMRECLASAGIAIRVGIMRVKHKNGKWVPMDATLTNMLHDPHINGIINNFWDVTEIRIAEQKVLNANRLYAFISQINQLIVHAKDEQELFNEACRIAIDQGKFKMAWIGITDISTTKINLIASRGIPETEIKAITDQSYDSNGPIEKTLNGLDYFVVNDMMSEEGISMHKYAVDQGIHSGISLAVKRSGQTIGSFTIYSTEINFFNEAEIALLKEAIADISFALDIFEKEKQKLVSDELLMHNELHLNQAQAIAHLGSWELDFATGIAVWSAEMLRIYGLSPQESHQSFEAWTNFIHPEDQDRVLQIIRKAYVTFNNASFTYRIIRKDGTVKHLSSESRFEFDPAGNPAGLYGTTLDVTERKLAEEELKASAEELRTTSERLLLATTSAKMGIWDWDIVTDRMTWDNRMYELYGIGKQHFTGAVSVWQNGVHPDDIERADKELNDAIKGISDFNSEFRVIWPDQSVHFIEANGIVSRNEEGVGIRMIGGNVDITERKLAEERVMELNEKVAKSEKFFKGVIENSDDMITILDPDGKTIYASPAVSKKFGYTNEECLNLNLADVVHPDDALIMHEFVMKIMMNPGLPMECPLIRNLKKDGTYIWVEGTLTNFLETEGINALVANFRNITERKKAEDENRFKANLLSTIGQAAVATDMNGLVNYWNKAAEQIYGWTKEEAIGKNIIDLTPSQATKEQAAAIMEQLKQGRAWSGEFGVRRKDGTEFPALVTNSPVLDANDQLTGIIGVSTDITEKKKLEDLLSKTNALARIGSWEVDLVKSKVYWSHMTKQIHEVDDDYNPSLEKGINFYKPGSKELIAQAVQQAMEQNVPYDLELQIVTGKGNERWVRTIGEAELRDGKCIRLYGSFQDIDARKTAETEVLKVYEERNIILESIGDGFFAIDCNWLITYWNKEAEKMFGKSKTELVGRHLWNAFPDNSASVSYKKYRQATETNEVVRFEDYDGPSAKWYGIIAYPSSNGLSVYIKDITERKMAVEQIRSEKNLLRTLIDNLPDNIYFKDKDARKVISNKVDYTMWGAGTEEEVLGKTDLEILPIGLAELTYRDDMKIIKTGNPLINFEEYLIRENGMPLWLLTTKMPVRNEKNEIIGLLGIGKDVTEMKIAEQKLAHLNLELENHVKQLEISNAELEHFAYIASHDLQEPLRIVMSFLAEIEKKYAGVIDEKGRQYIHFAVAGAKRMQQIILDLLEFIGLGKAVKHQIEMVNLNELLVDIISLFPKQINEANAIISLDILPFLETYKTPLRQVLQHLLSNALKYYKKDEPVRINISLRETDINWQFAVKDNGIGIDSAYFDKIFIIFQRLHTMDKYAGTGIGLAICKKVIENFGGKIWVTSEEGKGSIFHFSLPKKPTGVPGQITPAM